jgi:hypothetical protein
MGTHRALRRTTQVKHPSTVWDEENTLGRKLGKFPNSEIAQEGPFLAFLATLTRRGYDDTNGTPGTL